MEHQRKRSSPSFHITSENFEDLIGPGFWEIHEVPLNRLAQIRDHFADVDTYALFASGSAPRPEIPPSSTPAGGVDWVKLERNPRSGEPPLNVYHYVIGHPDERGYPVYGPLRGGSMAPHWSHLEDLDVYLSDDSANESGQGTAIIG